MINRYTAEKRMRHDDAYTPGNIGGKRPDRAWLCIVNAVVKLIKMCR